MTDMIRTEGLVKRYGKVVALDGLTPGGPDQEIGTAGPLRLFNQQLGGQASWLLPIAGAGLVRARPGARHERRSSPFDSGPFESHRPESELRHRAPTLAPRRALLPLACGRQ